jgi:branched-chain amino acid transport system substrate-binding protein
MKLIRHAAFLAAVLTSGAAGAQQMTDGVIKIGVMNDMSGLYADISGPGAVVAARMAVEDFGAAQKGLKVEVIGADHQNKPDVGSTIARKWLDVDQVDVIVDVPTSSVALAVNEIVRDKNKVFLVSGAAASDLTGPKCTPNTIHWTYDTWALANGTGKAVVKTGGDTWFFLTANYAFGEALERDTAAVVEKNGGKILGKVRHPFPGTDFSSYLLQAIIAATITQPADPTLPKPLRRLRRVYRSGHSGPYKGVFCDIQPRSRVTPGGVTSPST